MQSILDMGTPQNAYCNKTKNFSDRANETKAFPKSLKDQISRLSLEWRDKLSRQ